MRHLALLIMLLAAQATLVACKAPPPPVRRSVHLTLTFENMRRYVEADGEPMSLRDEWGLVEELIEDLRLHYHEKDNRFGITFEATRLVDDAGPDSLQTATYTVSLVVTDLDEVERIDRRIDALRGRRFGPARETAQVDPFEATVAYRSGFLRADLRVVLSGEAEPGTIVYLYDAFLDEPLRVVASQAGRWESAVNIANGQRNVYGYFLDPRARRPVYFRVNIATRVFQEVDRATVDAEFPSDYAGRRFRLGAPPDG